MSCCGPLSVVVLGVEIEGGVAESVGVFDVGSAGGGVEDRGVGRRAARGFMDRSGCTGSGNSVAPESTRHVTAFCYSRLGNTRCYCMAQKRRVIADGLACQVDDRRVVAAPLIQSYIP